MIRWRILKSAAVIFPMSVVLFSPFVEPIKRRIVNSSDLRVLKETNRSQRVQAFAVHNAGEANLSKVIVGVTIPSGVDRPIADFYFSLERHEPPISFVETLAHSEPWTKLTDPDKKKISPVVDDHSRNRNLYDVDQAFDSILIARMGPTMSHAVLPNPGDMNGSFDDWHYSWMRKCDSEQRPNDMCSQINGILENWEQSKRNLQVEAFNRWREATGVEIISPNRRLSPNGKVYFVFSVGPDESRFLYVRYGPNPIPLSDPVIYSSPTREITPVESESDLAASSLWIFCKYYRGRTGLWMLSILFCVGLVWPVIRPASLLATFDVFNLAMKTDDPAHWDLAAQRYKYRIFREYRDLWENFKFKGAPLPHGSDEVFDFIKNRVIDTRAKKFENEKDLSAFINTELKRLVEQP